VRVSTPARETHVTRQLDRSFLTRHVIKGVCTGDPYLIGSLTMGSRVSLGKNKWTAGTTASGVENTTIFSVHKANELMSTAPKHLDGVESRAARHMVDNTVVEIAGKKVKLLPDPTPGRAMAWGGTLAVWGTAAVVVGDVQGDGHQVHGGPAPGDARAAHAARPGHQGHGSHPSRDGSRTRTAPSAGRCAPWTPSSRKGSRGSSRDDEFEVFERFALLRTVAPRAARSSRAFVALPIFAPTLASFLFFRFHHALRFSNDGGMICGAFSNAEVTACCALVVAPATVPAYAENGSFAGSSRAPPLGG
jgi:hypothetical protein